MEVNYIIGTGEKKV